MVEWSKVPLSGIVISSLNPLQVFQIFFFNFLMFPSFSSSYRHILKIHSPLSLVLFGNCKTQKSKSDPQPESLNFPENPAISCFYSNNFLAFSCNFPENPVIILTTFLHFSAKFPQFPTKFPQNAGFSR